MSTPSDCRSSSDPATGRRTAVTNALNEVTHYHYSPEGQLLGTWGSVYPVFYEYDDFDRGRSGTCRN